MHAHERQRERESRHPSHPSRLRYCVSYDEIDGSGRRLVLDLDDCRERERLLDPPTRDIN